MVIAYDGLSGALGTSPRRISAQFVLASEGRAVTEYPYVPRTMHVGLNGQVDKNEWTHCKCPELGLCNSMDLDRSLEPEEPPPQGCPPSTTRPTSCRPTQARSSAPQIPPPASTPGLGAFDYPSFVYGYTLIDELLKVDHKCLWLRVWPCCCLPLRGSCCCIVSEMLKLSACTTNTQLHISIQDIHQVLVIVVVRRVFKPLVWHGDLD